MLPISWTDRFAHVISKQDHPGLTFYPYTDLQSRTEIIHVNLLCVNKLVYDVLWKKKKVEQKDKNKKVQKRQMTRTQTKERKKQDSKQASKVSVVESERRKKSQRERQLFNTMVLRKGSEDEGRRETSVQAKSSKNTPLFPHRKFNEFKPPSNFQYLSLLFRCGHRGQNFGIKRPRP